MPPPDLPLIICFGDSLTAGFQSPTATLPEGLNTPYGGFLQKQLKGRARIAISGTCGELTAQMVTRFTRDVLDHKPDYAVILGGPNDLGWNVALPDIMRNLVMMYRQAGEAGTVAVPVTVPSVRGFDAAIPTRYALNAMIAAYCAHTRLPCVDLFGATAEMGTGRLAEAYSNDGLHLTTAGYELLARLLYEEVFKDLN